MLEWKSDTTYIIKYIIIYKYILTSILNNDNFIDSEKYFELHNSILLKWTQMAVSERRLSDVNATNIKNLSTLERRL